MPSVLHAPEVHEQLALKQDDANSEERDQLRQGVTKDSLALGNVSG